MNAPRVVRLDDGSVRFENLAPWFLSVLLELPGMLVPGQGDAVDGRLFPDPSDDEEQRDEWRRLVHPELRRLFASAREIVTGDVTNLEPHDAQQPFGPWRLPVPEEHVDAWIAALNRARLTLSAKHGVEEEDMRAFEREHERMELGLPADEEDAPAGGGAAEDPQAARARRRAVEERRLAIAKIHLLGWLQGLLIDTEWPEPDGFHDPRANEGGGPDVALDDDDDDEPAG